MRIVVSGLIAQHPKLGGVAWDYAQYVGELRRLGHDVFYVEDSGEWPYDETGGATGNDWVAADPQANVRHLSQVMERFGMVSRWAYRWAPGGTWHGLTDAKRRDIVRHADLVLNVSGSLERPWEYRPVAGRLVYIDTDPGFTQIKLKLGREFAEFRRRVDAHDEYYTFGETLSPEYLDTGHPWKPTRQPIALDEWSSVEFSPGPRYTTILSWTSYPPLRHAEVTYGQKDIELRRFAELPKQVPGIELELALGGTAHAAWQTAAIGGEYDTSANPSTFLRSAGWHLAEPNSCCSTLDAYRSYVGRSRGEWSVAKNGYVVAGTGWFSCRSACYMAAGRPVVVQDTGFGRVLPVGEGLLSFSTVDESAEALVAVEKDYDRHARSAREIAFEYFGAERVLGELIDGAGH